MLTAAVLANETVYPKSALPDLICLWQRDEYNPCAAAFEVEAISFILAQCMGFALRLTFSRVLIRSSKYSLILSIFLSECQDEK